MLLPLISPFSITLQDYKMYRFHYVDKHGESHYFGGLSERLAKQMYKTFLRESVIHGYKQIGWEKSDGSYATGTSC